MTQQEKKARGNTDTEAHTSVLPFKHQIPRALDVYKTHGSSAIYVSCCVGTHDHMSTLQDGIAMLLCATEVG